MAYEDRIEIGKLVGRTLASTTGAVGDDQMVFVDTNGDKWLMYHDQACCESVLIEDVCGDIQDLVGNPILQAEETSNRQNDLERFNKSCTWTFYRFATAKGSVAVRWYGESNGCYSERVNVERTST